MGKGRRPGTYRSRALVCSGMRAISIPAVWTRQEVKRSRGRGGGGAKGAQLRDGQGRGGQTGRRADAGRMREHLQREEDRRCRRLRA